MVASQPTYTRYIQHIKQQIKYTSPNGGANKVVALLLNFPSVKAGHFLPKPWLLELKESYEIN